MLFFIASPCFKETSILSTSKEKYCLEITTSVPAPLLPPSSLKAGVEVIGVSSDE